MNGLRELSRKRWFPIAAGAAVGFITGLLGVVMTGQAGGWGGMVGAVSGGATAATLSERGVRLAVLNAVVADAVSSVVFFALVFVGVMGWIAGEVGVWAVAALPYVIFGSLVAIPIAAVSLTIAAISGGIVALGKRSLA